MRRGDGLVKASWLRLVGEMAETPPDPRQKRLAEALRANLSRRKARDRAEKAATPPEEEPKPLSR